MAELPPTVRPNSTKIEIDRRQFWIFPRCSNSFCPLAVCMKDVSTLYNMLCSAGDVDSSRTNPESVNLIAAAVMVKSRRSLRLGVQHGKVEQRDGRSREWWSERGHRRRCPHQLWKYITWS